MREIASYRNGKAHKKNIFENGDFIVINSRFISTNGNVIKYSDKQMESMKINEIAFVLSDVPNGRAIARTFLVEENNKYTLNQRIAGITPHSDTDPYLLYILLNRHPYFLRFDNGVGQTNLQKKDVEDFTEKYPSTEEQSKIGKTFKLLDCSISLHQHKIQILEKIKNKYLYKIFPKEGKNEPELRFNSFYQAWEQRELTSFYAVTMGHSPKSENYTSNPNDYILVQGNADILNGWVSPRVWTTQVTSLAPAGSILISVRAPVGNVGKTAHNVVIGRGMAAIEGDEFIFQLLSKMHIEKYWKRVSTGSTFESINSKDIKEALIKLPDAFERESIGNFLKKFDEYISLHQSKLSTLEQLKQSYLRKMFL